MAGFPGKGETGTEPKTRFLQHFLSEGAANLTKPDFRGNGETRKMSDLHLPESLAGRGLPDTSKSFKRLLDRLVKFDNLATRTVS
jgi:hypothetical protein